MSRTLIAAAPLLLLCMACECRDVSTHRGIPDRVALTLWGMDEGADPLDGLDLWGEGRYAVEVADDGQRSAVLTLGSGQLDVALHPPEGDWIAGDASGLPIVAIELVQSRAPEPGSQRTLVQGDFDGIRIRAVIDGAVFADASPQIELGLDLATGATAVTASGVLSRVGGAEAEERIYSLAGEGIIPVDCLYRVAGDNVVWTPPEGQPDVCRALVDRAAALPASDRTPEPPWNPAAPEFETICGL